MNEAPSPPKFVLATETSGLTNIPQLKTLTSCLKQSKNISPNASNNNSALYNSVLVNETNNLLLKDNSKVLPTLSINLANKTTQASNLEQFRSPPEYAEAIEHLKRNIISNPDNLVVNNVSTFTGDVNESRKLATVNQNLKSHLNEEIETNNKNIVLRVKQQQTTKNHKHIYSKSNVSHKNKHLSHILQEADQQKTNCTSQKYTTQQSISNEYHQYQHLMHLPSSSHSLQYLSNNNYKTIDSNLLNQLEFYQQQQSNYEPKNWQNLSTNPSKPLIPFSLHENYLNSKTLYSFQSPKLDPKLNFDNQQKHKRTSLFSTVNNEENKQVIKRRYASRSPAMNRVNNISIPSTETEYFKNANINNNLTKDQIINKILKNTAYNNINQNNNNIPLSPPLQQTYKSNMMPTEYKTVDFLPNPIISINNNITNKNCFSEYNNYTPNKITTETTKNSCEIKMSPPKYNEIISTINNTFALSTTTSTTLKKNHQLTNNTEVISKLSSCHFNETSLSNTEKFKNYPMMKALWEARHDLNSIFYYLF